MISTARVIVTSALTAAAVALFATPAQAGDTEAPLPTCRRSPASADQGDTVRVRGRSWAPGTTVTVLFDEDEVEPLTDDDVDDDGDVDDDEALDDDATGGAVDEDGRFELTFTVPEDAVRGTHSIDVVGEDEDGFEARCARVLRLDEHPEDGDDDVPTTDDTGPDGTSPTSSGTSSSTSSSTTTSTLP